MDIAPVDVWVDDGGSSPPTYAGEMRATARHELRVNLFSFKIAHLLLLTTT